MVAWRSGRTSVVDDIRPNQLRVLHEPTNAPPSLESRVLRRAPAAADSPALFADASQLFAHRHFEAPFDDFERQPLLPNRMSQPGPGVAWHDLDGDGWDDIAIGTGRGGQLAVFLNDRHGGFKPLPMPRSALSSNRDVTGLIGDPLGCTGTLFSVSLS